MRKTLREIYNEAYDIFPGNHNTQERAVIICAMIVAEALRDFATTKEKNQEKA